MKLRYWPLASSVWLLRLLLLSMWAAALAVSMYALRHDQWTLFVIVWLSTTGMSALAWLGRNWALHVKLDGDDLIAWHIARTTRWRLKTAEVDPHSGRTIVGRRPTTLRLAASTQLTSSIIAISAGSAGLRNAVLDRRPDLADAWPERQFRAEKIQVAFGVCVTTYMWGTGLVAAVALALTAPFADADVYF